MVIGRARKARGGVVRRPWARLLGLAALALLAFAASAAAKVNLSVAFQTAPPTATVNTAISYVVAPAVNSGSPSNVWVTTVFSLGVHFNAYPAGSSQFCVANEDQANNPGTTVMCPWTSGAITVNITPKIAGSMKVIASIIAAQLDTNMSNNYSYATTTVSSGGSVTVTAITPRAGASAGSKGVTITGTGFAAGAMVTIGGSAATGVSVVNSTTITATTPAHAAGAGNVVVTVSGSPGTLTNGYTFMAATVFTDDPLVQFSTAVKALHILNLRSAIATLRSVAGLSAPTWTYAVAAGVIARAVDVQEMRTQLNPALTNLGYSTSGYTDSTLQPQVTLIKKVHIDELRNRVKQVTN